MRVLHIGKYYPPFSGGIESFMGDLLPALASLTVTTAALVHAHSWQPSGSASINRIDGVLVIRAPTWGRLLYAPISPLFSLSLRRIIHSFKPDILHLHLPNTSAFWVLHDTTAQTIPWIIHWHADVVASHLDWRLKFAYPLYRPFEQHLLSRAAAIIVTSPPYMNSSPALAPWLNKCHAIPLGINRTRLIRPDFLVRHATQALWANQGLRILAIGRLTYYKGHEVLIRAIAEIPDSQLILIGGGERKRYLENLIRKLNLISRVHLLGQLPTPMLQGLLASCDCLCLPSLERTEAFGVVLLEAMHYERPVICSNVLGSGMSWVVEDNKTGLLVPPNDVMALVNAIKKLANSVELRQQLGSNGKAKLKERFTITSIAPQIVDLYHQTLNLP